MVWESIQAVEKPSGSNIVNLTQIPGHHGILGDEEADKLAEDQTVGITFVGKEAVRSHLRQAPERVKNL
jgi:hypothetical protein